MNKFHIPSAIMFSLNRSKFLAPVASEGKYEFIAHQKNHSTSFLMIHKTKIGMQVTQILILRPGLRFRRTTCKMQEEITLFKSDNLCTYVLVL